jgi:hypothetical protein
MKFTSYLSGIALILAAVSFAAPVPEPITGSDLSMVKRQGIQQLHNYVGQKVKGGLDSEDSSDEYTAPTKVKRQGIQQLHNYVGQKVKGGLDSVDSDDEYTAPTKVKRQGIQQLHNYVGQKVKGGLASEDSGDEYTG